ncbi:four helix bundle protein [bacterium]|nr:four helix bundle protein [bacterium]MBU1066058.1 four helix bundle protein [bacterium]MBU1635950.1 four helix bundle protein [bacterium]MBU1875034.1 four helix bundle protein [bacterium]
MKLEELNVYNLAMDLGERIWNIMKEWEHFEKDTIGKQLIRAIDSVAANLSEGFGRYHYREVKNFSYYSRGSLYEAKTWLTKANNRALIVDDDYEDLIKEINNLGVKLNNYIKSIGKATNDNK